MMTASLTEERLISTNVYMYFYGTAQQIILNTKCIYFVSTWEMETRVEDFYEWNKSKMLQEGKRRGK